MSPHLQNGDMQLKSPPLRTIPGGISVPYGATEELDLSNRSGLEGHHGIRIPSWLQPSIRSNEYRQIERDHIEIPRRNRCANFGTSIKTFCCAHPYAIGFLTFFALLATGITVGVIYGSPCNDNCPDSSIDGGDYDDGGDDDGGDDARILRNATRLLR